MDQHSRENRTATVDNTFTLTITEEVVASPFIGELRKVIESLTSPMAQTASPEVVKQARITTPPARASTPVL